MSQPETNEEWLKHYDKLRLKAWKPLPDPYWPEENA